MAARDRERRLKTGVAVGDYDNDGYLDLYVTAFGPNVLYSNNGDGTFTDVTAAAGVAGGAAEWSTSTGFFDDDRDGDLDLYVVNYLDYRIDDNPYCGLRKDGLPDLLPPDALRRRCPIGCSATTATARSPTSRAGRHRQPGRQGARRRFCDFDRDGDQDVYIANDRCRNFLYRNNGDGTFMDVAYGAGVGFDANGKPQAGMGVDCADVDGNGLSRHLRDELRGRAEHALQEPRRGPFEDIATSAGLGRASSRSVSARRCSTSTTTAISISTSPTATSSTT